MLCCAVAESDWTILDQSFEAADGRSLLQDILGVGYKKCQEVLQLQRQFTVCPPALGILITSYENVGTKPTAVGVLLKNQTS